MLNCQSIVAKKESFINLLDVYHPDVVFGCESWQNPVLYPVKFIFPSRYTIYREDRVDGYGGVFIACRDILTFIELTFTNSSSELLACKIHLADRSSLIACAIYRPPSSNESYLEDLSNQLRLP